MPDSPACRESLALRDYFKPRLLSATVSSLKPRISMSTRVFQGRFPSYIPVLPPPLPTSLLQEASLRSSGWQPPRRSFLAAPRDWSTSLRWTSSWSTSRWSCLRVSPPHSARESEGTSVCRCMSKVHIHVPIHM